MENIKKEFEAEFDKTVGLVLNNYDKSKDIAEAIVEIIINNSLKQIQIDIYKMPFVDFYIKYIHNPNVLEYKDFTVSQIKRIIDESPLDATDRQIAYKLFVEKKTYSEIAGECYIAEPKTVSNNRDRISEILKKTATKILK